MSPALLSRGATPGSSYSWSLALLNEVIWPSPWGSFIRPSADGWIFGCQRHGL